MSLDIPERADVVIVGGGVAGCPVAYRLTKLGITDVVLCERKQLTSGTSWHAAGLVTRLRATRQMAEIAKYTGELFGSMEADTGQPTGCKRRGSLRIAKTRPAWTNWAAGRRWAATSACRSRVSRRARSGAIRARTQGCADALSSGACVARGGKIVGSITSRAYGHRIGASLGMGYVEDPDGIDDAWLAAMPLEIEVAWKHYPARAQLQPWHDPKGARLKG